MEATIREAFEGVDGRRRGRAAAAGAAARGFALIDRPSAPQSTVMLGLPVPDPSSQDYIALEVTDSLLGGSFGSRITSNIREQKGYTYSPYSSVNSASRSTRTGSSRPTSRPTSPARR